MTELALELVRSCGQDFEALCPCVLCGGLQQRRLADARRAGEDDDRARALADGVAHLRELFVAFQQHTGKVLAPHPLCAAYPSRAPPSRCELPASRAASRQRNSSSQPRNGRGLPSTTSSPRGTPAPGSKRSVS